MGEPCSAPANPILSVLYGKITGLSVETETSSAPTGGQTFTVQGIRVPLGWRLQITSPPPPGTMLMEAYFCPARNPMRYMDSWLPPSGTHGWP